MGAQESSAASPTTHSWSNGDFPVSPELAALFGEIWSLQRRSGTYTAVSVALSLP
jgi:hypothetical protein